jgi:hypothetical protein
MDNATLGDPPRREIRSLTLTATANGHRTRYLMSPVVDHRIGILPPTASGAHSKALTDWIP